jgi:hypothetical protein
MAYQSEVSFEAPDYSWRGFAGRLAALVFEREKITASREYFLSISI